MSSYPQPLPGYDLGAFNAFYFSWADKSLTLDQADHRYLHLTGGHISGSLSIDGSCDVGSLKIAGSTVDLSSLSGTTHGLISADKAVIVDSNKDISAFRNLTATGTLSGGSLSLTASSPTMNLSAPTGINNSCIWTGGAQPTTMNGIGIRFIGMSNTGIIRSYNYILGQANNININDGAIYVKSDGKVGISNVAPAYALDITGFCNASSGFKVGGTTIVDSSRNATLGTITGTNFITANANLDDADFQKLDGITNGTVAAGKCVVLSSNKDAGVIRRLTCKNINVQGDTGSTDDYSNLSRLVNAIDSSMGNGSSRYITLGKAFSSKNSGEIAYMHSSDGSDDNRLALGGYGFSDTLSVFGSSTVAIGTTSRSNARLYVDSGVGNSTIAGSSQIEILSNSSLSQQIAPLTVSNPSIRTAGNIICGGTLYVSSDRRLKKDIHPFSAKQALRFIQEIDPVLFKLKGAEREQFGYVAQDLLAKSYGQLVELQPSEGMKYEGSVYDFDDYALSVSYDRVCALLHRAMQHMMARLDKLESKLG